MVERDEGAPHVSWATNEPTLLCQREGGRKLECEATDIPAIHLDRDVRSYVDIVPQLFVGFTDTWEAVRNRVLGLVEDAARPNPAIDSRIKELVADAATEREKFRRLYRFVADDVRYVALAHGEHAVVPHRAPVTLDRRYGDCKDKVTLLVALAASAGLDVFPVLTNTGRYRASALLRPASGYFNHMIACTRFSDGEESCVDLTSPYMREALPLALGGAVALRLRKSGPASVTTLPEPRFAWEVDTRRSIRISCDGKIEQDVVRRFGGPGGAALRQQLAAWRTEEQIRWASDEYEQAVPNSTAPKFSFEGLIGADSDLTVRYASKAGRRYEVAEGEFLAADPWLASYLLTMRTTNHHHAYYMSGVRYHAEDSVEPCERRIVRHGAALRFESQFGQIVRHYRVRDGRLIVTTLAEIPAAEMSPETAREFSRFLENTVAETSVGWSLEHGARRR